MQTCCLSSKNMDVANNDDWEKTMMCLFHPNVQHGWHLDPETEAPRWISVIAQLIIDTAPPEMF